MCELIADECTGSYSFTRTFIHLFSLDGGAPTMAAIDRAICLQVVLI
jgi:hypothetical protein